MHPAVPFLDFSRAVANMRDQLTIAIDRVLQQGWFILGEESGAFEREFADWCGTEHAVGVASGTDAIELALRSLGIGPGDEVVTQANTCVPTVAAIERAGGRPVLCDVEPDAATMDPTSLERVLTPRTRAVVPVHLYGQCADMGSILRLVEERGIAVVEDCAQAHGAKLDGRRAGTMGAMGCFSFYPTKNLGALGDAGAVVTDDDALAARLRLIRQYGQTDRYRHVVPGVNSRLDEIQAAILRLKLPRVEEWNDRRRGIAEVYAASLVGTAVAPLQQLPNRTHAFHLFVVRVGNRARFREALAAQGVATLVHYPYPIHGHEPYAELGRGVPLRNAEALASSVVSLPLYPELTDEEASFVASAARAAAQAV
jgi:dTDP-4-amino-4,6-dideoxygalactose transaminase